jgi:EAL domain-containing protein (putative c-di-GMP-specific phosphodiesterase class I)
VVIGSSTLSIEASFGVALYPEHGTDLSMLMIYADAAMYQGKRGVERKVIWQPGTATAPTHRHELHSELQRALEGEELVLHYQPKIDLTTDRPVSVEALARWNHPQRGLLPPSEFVAATEASSLIHPFTDWVLERALRDRQAWTALGADWSVAVNISAHNLESPDFVQRVLRLLVRYGAAPSDLILELTETAFAHDNATAESAVAALGIAGVRVSLDDFGTGATGLLQLRSLAVDEIKIDRVFVHELMDNTSDRNLVRAMVDLAHTLSCRVVAEGVEDDLVGSWLRSVGCDQAQGYGYHRPSPWPELIDHYYPHIADAAGIRPQDALVTAAGFATIEGAASS